jgi:hypothetical protein
MSTNTSGMGSGVTLAAMGATLLFALTTIAAGIWGGMQYQALQASRAECAALEQRVASLKGEMDQMAAQPAPMPPPPPPSQMPPPPPAPGMGMIPPAQGMPGMPPPPPAEGDGQENLMGAAMKMFEGEQGDAMIRAATGMQIGVMYGDFLDQYGLTPEKRAQVEEILRAHMAEQMRVGMGAMAGASGDPASQAQAMQEATSALDQSLRDQLAQILSPRELNDWDQYEATREERMIAKSLEMQLNMPAGSMSSEGRDLARDVLAEETFAAIQRTQGANTPAVDPTTAMTQGFAAQSEAVRIARERLTNALSPGDMQAFDRFAESMRAQQEMVGGMMGGQSPAPPQPQR